MVFHGLIIAHHQPLEDSCVYQFHFHVRNPHASTRYPPHERVSQMNERINTEPPLRERPERVTQQYQRDEPRQDERPSDPAAGRSPV